MIVEQLNEADGQEKICPPPQAAAVKHLRYNLDTTDDNERAHCCGMCKYGAYDIDRGNVCLKDGTVTDSKNQYWPNDCEDWETPSLSASRCKTAADRKDNKRERNNHVKQQ